MSAEQPIYRVWAEHLREQSLTVLDRDVRFDSAGRSAPLTEVEFVYLMGIGCFASDGPVPSTRDFLPSAYTIAQWLICQGINPLLVGQLSEEQQEMLAMDLRACGGMFAISYSEFAAKMQAKQPTPMLVSQLPTLEEQSEDFELLTDPRSGEALVKVSEGYQNPDAATALGLEDEGPKGNETDMLTQFRELSPDARAEFVLDGSFTREQLDTLFNLEGQEKKLRNKSVLGAITTALQRLPVKTAEMVNEALVKESAKG